MTSEQRRYNKKRPTGEPLGDAAGAATPPAQLHPSIASLHDIHRAAHPDGVEVDVDSSITSRSCTKHPSF
ncbi:hypothetical protein M5K25_015933 [Dendrobium thyrsiflorum]|uniref:Uncharacterized protein n=1 Tax=Dendrobium thyrsiflorum TaxID=117978 RepID=A0ABD0UZK8_DENTH